MEPLNSRVWFAGEAVHETLWGTVGGAWESGERAATDALRKIGALKDPEPVKPQPQRPAVHTVTVELDGAFAHRDASTATPLPTASSSARETKPSL